MNKNTYRKATHNDIEVVTDLLYLLYNSEEGGASGASAALGSPGASGAFTAPGLSRRELLDENERHFADASQAMFLAFDGDKPIGIAHGSLRREYVNGANDGLKGYLEAIYVLPRYRLNGIASTLARTVERWAAQNGCREIASDCLLDNTDSYNFHLKIGYEETERSIFFLKQLEPEYAKYGA